MSNNSKLNAGASANAFSSGKKAISGTSGLAHPELPKILSKQGTVVTIRTVSTNTKNNSFSSVYDLYKNYVSVQQSLGLPSVSAQRKSETSLYQVIDIKKSR